LALFLNHTNQTFDDQVGVASHKVEVPISMKQDGLIASSDRRQ
jgi:hypothetical protein